MSAVVDPDDIASVTIQLKILEGKDLVAKDRSMLGKRTTSDPYVEVFLGDKNYGHKTKVIEKTLDPKWNESFKIMVTGDHARDILRHEHPFRLVIWDKDLAIDDCMGVVDIIVDDIAMEGPEWVAVENGTPDVRPEGQRIHFCKNATGELKIQYSIKCKTMKEAYG